MTFTADERKRLRAEIDRRRRERVHDEATLGRNKLGLRLGVAALLAPAPVLVPGTRLFAAARRRHVGTLLASRTPVCHWVVLSRCACGSLPVVRKCSESPYEKDGRARLGRARSDRDGTLRAAPVGLAWQVSFLVGGDPGWCLGHHLLRGERYLLTSVERKRQTRKKREVYVQLHALQPAHAEYREAVLTLAMRELFFDQRTAAVEAAEALCVPPLSSATRLDPNRKGFFRQRPLERQLAWLRCWYGTCRWQRPARGKVYAKRSAWR